MKKTNALRILETAGIPYCTVTYQWDEEHLDAVSAAEKLALDPEAVFKTIVMISEADCCLLRSRSGAYQFKKDKKHNGQKNRSAKT